MKVRVAVVGGGLAGFFTASELMEAGVEDVVVLDRNDQPGGVARTVKLDGYDLEPAAGKKRAGARRPRHVQSRTRMNRVSG